MRCFCFSSVRSRSSDSASMEKDETPTKFCSDSASMEKDETSMKFFSDSAYMEKEQTSTKFCSDNSAFVEKDQTSNKFCVWATDMLDLRHQIEHTLESSKAISSYNQCVVFKTLVNTVVRYVQLWWVNISEEDAMEVGNQLLGVLKDGHKVVWRCAEDDSENSIALLGGDAGECFKIIDDVKKYCQMMNELIAEKSNTFHKQVCQDSVESDCSMLQNSLISAHEKDKEAFMLLGEVQINALELEKITDLGTGSFSVVWKASWQKMPLSFKRLLPNDNNKYVAVKEFNYNDHFDVEHGIFMKLKKVANCSQIVKVFGYTNFEDTGKKCLVMEFMDMDLKSLIKEKHPLSLFESISIMLQIAKGMRSLHSVDVIHRDMKPHNVLMRTNKDGSYCVKIADFNTSKTGFRTYVTNTNRGTTTYMAPEIVLDEDEGHYCRKVDVYSFGIICTEILTGKLEEVGQMHSLPQDIPWDLDDMIHRCRRPKAEERPTFEDIVHTLEENLEVISSITDRKI